VAVSVSVLNDLIETETQLCGRRPLPLLQAVCSPHCQVVFVPLAPIMLDDKHVVVDEPQEASEGGIGTAFWVTV